MSADATRRLVHDVERLAIQDGDLVVITLPDFPGADATEAMMERLRDVKEEIGLRFSFIILDGEVTLERLSEEDLARLGLRRIDGEACGTG